MGGYRSGRRFDAKGRVEDCLAFSSSWMLQNNYLDLSIGQTKYISVTWSNNRNELAYTLTGQVERVAPHQVQLYLGTTGQVVYLCSTECRYGGLRWWFNCPGCARRCAKLYLRKHSVFLCRSCHDLTYEVCVSGKSTTAFLAEIGAQLGLKVADVKKGIAEDTRARNKWRRKRDRRAGYKERAGGLPAGQEKSLKRKFLEMKVANDMVKTLSRISF